MERLRKLKPSFHSIGSYYCRTRITPIAADSSVGERFRKCKVDQAPSAADSPIRERFIKCKPRLPLIHQNLSRTCAFPSSSSRFALNSAHTNPFSSGSKRLFSGGVKEEESLSVEEICGLLTVAALLVCCFSSFTLETRKEVPYTHRENSLISSDCDRKLGEKLLEKKMIKEAKGVILPATHPLSVKVCSILKKLLDALHRDLGLDETPVVAYHGLADTTVLESNQIRTEKSGGRRDKSGLKGMNWQVVVVDKHEKEAYSLGGGIIVVSSGFLNQYSDLWIAAVLAHEVGHSVARHVVEFVGYACLRTHKSTLVDMYQRAEEEASNIGSQLMASAGYDPHVYANLEINYSEFEENGPISLKERIRPNDRYLHVKKEECTMYKLIKSGK